MVAVGEKRSVCEGQLTVDRQSSPYPLPQLAYVEIDRLVLGACT